MALKPALEAADIFRQYGPDYIKEHGPPIDHLKVISALTACRTAQLGGHLEVCSEGCGYQQNAYNSCRNRHCPKCQGSKAFKWCQAREDDLLAVPYFHVVFTLPTAPLMPVILPNKKYVFTLMFQCVSETLKELGRDPKHLGANIGAICILHTWTQRLAFHPHIHCIVPAGGLSEAGDQWISPRKDDFFVRVEVLAKLFQYKLLAKLKALNKQGKLSFLANDQHLHDPHQFKRFCQPLYDQPWVTYAKPAFKGPTSVIHYLGRYVHKIAISNWRLVSLHNDQVTFIYRDRANGNVKRTTSLHALDFIKMFLQHVLPPKFAKIRAYGILSNRSKKKRLAQARSLLAKGYDSVPDTSPKSKSANDGDQNTPKRCPRCRKGVLKKVLVAPLRAFRPP